MGFQPMHPPQWHGVSTVFNPCIRRYSGYLDASTGEPMLTRRQFVIGSAISIAALTSRLPAQTTRVTLRKAIKFDSVSVGKTLEERMNAIRAAGFRSEERRVGKE